MSQIKIDKKSLEHLANLAKIKLDPEQEDKLTADIQNILEYVALLQEIDTTATDPMNGGTMLKNIFREDEQPQNTNQRQGANDFSDSENDFLKIPAVLENNSDPN